MKLRIARKICRYMGYGYPIENTQRLNTAVHVWERAQKRFTHFKRNVTMSKIKPKYKPNVLYKNAGWAKRNFKNYSQSSY